MMLKIIRGRHILRSRYSTNKLLLSRNTTLPEVKYAVYDSNIQWRGRSHAASVPSDVPKAKRGQKKVSKDERRAMMESFVSKYRATHNGKFPSVTDALKHVGGSFYVIRTMLQELEYKSKISSSGRGAEEKIGVGLIKKNQVTRGVEFQDELHMIVAQDMDIIDTSDKHLEAEGGSLASSMAGRTLFEAVERAEVPGGQSGGECGKKEELEGVSSYFEATEAHTLKGETQEVSHPCIGNSDEKSDNQLESGGEKHEEQYKWSFEPQKNAVDISSRHSSDEEIPKKLTMWGSLKSFADGFINMWRRL